MFLACEPRGEAGDADRSARAYEPTADARLEIEMRNLRSRTVETLAAVAMLALVLGACGGGGDDDASFEGETVESAGGMLTVQVPEGAAPDGVEVTVTRIDAGDLPPELWVGSGATVAV
jgi:hypothetical protein